MTAKWKSAGINSMDSDEVQLRTKKENEGTGKKRPAYWQTIMTSRSTVLMAL